MEDYFSNLPDANKDSGNEYNEKNTVIEPDKIEEETYF